MLPTLITLALSYSGGGGPDGTGQTCDAINLCAGGTCPKGMDKVAIPERSDTYHIRTSRGANPADDPASYIPGERVTIWITVTKKLIQRRMNKGVKTCLCDYPERARVKSNCLPVTHNPPRVINGVTYTTTQCTEKQMDTSKWIGLLLYAVDANEKKKGAWELRETPPAVFWTPTDYDCGGHAVMHADATPKGYAHSLTFRAPEAGAGPLTFRALLKHGDTNGGSFYWPLAPAMGTAAALVDPEDGVAGGDLVLREAGAIPPQEWFRATGPGQSCDHVCGMNGGSCDLSKLTLMASNPTSLQSSTEPYFSTISPPIAGCDSALPAVTEGFDENWLFFHADRVGANTCGKDELRTPSCAAVPVEDLFKMRRLCPCKLPTVRRRRLRTSAEDGVNVKQAETPSPPQTSGSKGAPGCPHYTPPVTATASAETTVKRRLEEVAPATPSHPNAAGPSRYSSLSTPIVLGALTLGLSTASAQQRRGLAPLLPIAVVMTVAALMPTASAHNWMWNPSSRASQASTTKPCRSRRTTIPDVHVNPGQLFEAEWATGHGVASDQVPRKGNGHFFTVVKAEDADMMVLISTTVLNDYIDSAPVEAEWLPTLKWDKRHLSWNTSQEGARNSDTSACDDIKHEEELKTRSHAFNDPHYIERPDSFKCYRAGKHKSSPSSGDGCYSVAGGLSQWRYGTLANSIDKRVSYKSEKYPWIVSAHRFASNNGWAGQGDIARFKIDGEPGEYILHWYWRGYSDCNDIAVMPLDEAAGTVVPEASVSKYGIIGANKGYARIDHCAFGGGRMQLMKFDAAGRSNFVPKGQCSDNPIQFDNRKPPRQTSDYRVCHVVPAEGNVNALNETRTLAMERCLVACDKLGSACLGVNVVPLEAPAQTLFKASGTCTLDPKDWSCKGSDFGERLIPYGVSNCDASCFAQETSPADSMVCYPLRLGTNRHVEEDWTLAVADPLDEVWYSTCYKREAYREFHGFTTCMNYTSEKFPSGMCSAGAKAESWRHDGTCISCDAMEKNSLATTTLPLWSPIPADQCRMCDHKVMSAEAAIAAENAAAVIAAVAAASEDLQAYVFRQNGYAILAFVGVNGAVLLVVAIVVASIAIAIGVSRKRFHAMPDAVKRQLVDGQNVEMQKQTKQKKKKRPLSMSAHDSNHGLVIGTAAHGFAPQLPQRPLSHSAPGAARVVNISVASAARPVFIASAVATSSASVEFLEEGDGLKPRVASMQLEEQGNPLQHQRGGRGVAQGEEKEEVVLHF